MARAMARTAGKMRQQALPACIVGQHPVDPTIRPVMAIPISAPRNQSESGSSQDTPVTAGKKRKQAVTDDMLCEEFLPEPSDDDSD